MAPSLSTLAILSLAAATSLAASTTLEARKPPSITFIDSAVEAVAGKACGLWSIIHHETKPVVKPSCQQWVSDASQLLPFKMVTGVYEGKCSSWNVRVTANNVAQPECGEGHRHGGKDVEDVLDGDKDHRAGKDLPEDAGEGLGLGGGERKEKEKTNGEVINQKLDEERKAREKEDERNAKAVKEKEKEEKKKHEEIIKEMKDKDGKQKRQVITVMQDGKRVAVPDLWSDVKQ